jgi:hypothetical protein
MADPKITISLCPTLSDGQLETRPLGEYEIKLIPIGTHAYLLTRSTQYAGAQVIENIATLATILNSAQQFKSRGDETFNLLSSQLSRLITLHNCRVADLQGRWMTRALLNVPYLSHVVRWFLPVIPAPASLHRHVSTLSFEKFALQIQQVTQKNIDALTHQINEYLRTCLHTPVEADRLRSCCTQIHHLQRTVAALELDHPINSNHPTIRAAHDLNDFKRRMAALRQTLTQADAALRREGFSAHLESVTTRLTSIETVALRSFSSAYARAADLKETPDSQLLQKYFISDMTGLETAQSTIEQALQALQPIRNSGLSQAELQVIEDAVRRIKRTYHQWLENRFRTQARQTTPLNENAINILRAAVHEQRVQSGDNADIVKRLDNLLTLTANTYHYRYFFEPDPDFDTNVDAYFNAGTTTRLNDQLEQALRDFETCGRLYRQLFSSQLHCPWENLTNHARNWHAAALKKIAPTLLRARHYHDLPAREREQLNPSDYVTILKELGLKPNEVWALSVEENVWIQDIRKGFEDAYVRSLEQSAFSAFRQCLRTYQRLTQRELNPVLEQITELRRVCPRKQTEADRLTTCCTLISELITTVGPLELSQSATQFHSIVRSSTNLNEFKTKIAAIRQKLTRIETELKTQQLQVDLQPVLAHLDSLARIALRRFTPAYEYACSMKQAPDSQLLQMMNLYDYMSLLTAENTFQQTIKRLQPDPESGLNQEELKIIADQTARITNAYHLWLENMFRSRARTTTPLTSEEKSILVRLVEETGRNATAATAAHVEQLRNLLTLTNHIERYSHFFEYSSHREPHAHSFFNASTTRDLNTQLEQLLHDFEESRTLHTALFGSTESDPWSSPMAQARQLHEHALRALAPTFVRARTLHTSYPTAAEISAAFQSANSCKTRLKELNLNSLEEKALSPDEKAFVAKVRQNFEDAYTRIFEKEAVLKLGQLLKNCPPISRVDLGALLTEINEYGLLCPSQQAVVNRLTTIHTLIDDLRKTVSDLELDRTMNSYHSMIQSSNSLLGFTNKIAAARQKMSQIDVDLMKQGLAINLQPMTRLIDALESVGLRKFAPAYAQACDLQNVSDLFLLQKFYIDDTTPLPRAESAIKNALTTLQLPDSGLNADQQKVIQEAVSRIEMAYSVWLENYFRKEALQTNPLTPEASQILERLVEKMRSKTGANSATVKKLETLLTLSTKISRYRHFFKPTADVNIHEYFSGSTTQILESQLLQILNDFDECSRIHLALVAPRTSDPWKGLGERARNWHTSALRKIAPTLYQARHYDSLFPTVEKLLSIQKAPSSYEEILKELNLKPEEEQAISAEEQAFVAQIRDRIEQAYAVALEHCAQDKCRLFTPDTTLERQLSAFVAEQSKKPAALQPKNMERLQKFVTLMDGIQIQLKAFPGSHIHSPNPFSAEASLKGLREKYQAHQTRIQELQKLFDHLCPSSSFPWNVILNQCSQAYLQALNRIHPSLGLAARVLHCPADESVLTHLSLINDRSILVTCGNIKRILNDLKSEPQHSLEAEDKALVDQARDRLWEAYGVWIERKLDAHQTTQGHLAGLNEFNREYVEPLKAEGRTLPNRLAFYVRLHALLSAQPTLFNEAPFPAAPLFPETANTMELDKSYQTVCTSFADARAILKELDIPERPIWSMKEKEIKDAYEVALKKIHPNLLPVRALPLDRQVGLWTVKTPFTQVIKDYEEFSVFLMPAGCQKNKMSPSDLERIQKLEAKSKSDLKTWMETNIPARAEGLADLTFRTLFMAHTPQERKRVIDFIQPYLIDRDSPLAKTVQPLLDRLPLDEFLDNESYYIPQDTDTVETLLRKRAECMSLKQSTSFEGILTKCERHIIACNHMLDLKVWVPPTAADTFDDLLKKRMQCRALKQATPVAEVDLHAKCERYLEACDELLDLKKLVPPTATDSLAQIVQKRTQLGELKQSKSKAELQRQCDQLIEGCNKFLEERLPLYSTIRRFQTQPQGLKLNTVDVAEYQFLLKHCFKIERDVIPQPLQRECEQALAVLGEIKAEEVKFNDRQVFERLLSCIYDAGRIKYNAKTKVQRSEKLLSISLNFAAWGNDITLLLGRTTEKDTYLFSVEIFSLLDSRRTMPENILPECRAFYDTYHSRALDGVKHKLLSMSKTPREILEYPEMCARALQSIKEEKPLLCVSIFKIEPYAEKDLFDLTKYNALMVSYKRTVETLEKLNEENKKRLGAFCPFINQAIDIVDLALKEWHAHRFFIIRKCTLKFAQKAGNYAGGRELMRSALMCVAPLSAAYLEKEREADIKKQWREYNKLFHTDKLINYPPYYQTLLGEGYKIASGLYQVNSAEEFSKM